VPAFLAHNSLKLLEKCNLPVPVCEFRHPQLVKYAKCGVAIIACPHFVLRPCMINVTTPLVVADDVATDHLRIPHWQVTAGECWAVIGRNGAGKHHLNNLLTRVTLPKTGNLAISCDHIGLLSFEQQQLLYERELKDDDSEFMEGADTGTTVADLLELEGKQVPSELHFLGLEPLLERGYRLLSSGEARKVLLARQWLRHPQLLILDEPFDSLDRDMRAALAEFFATIAKQGKTTLLFLLNTLDDVFAWHSHIAVLDQGELLATGPASEMRQDAAVQALLTFDATKLPQWPEPLPRQESPDPMIVLRNGNVRYDEQTIFTGIELTVRHGAHTLLTGPNGSG
jgi:molybdate transport system ATP-binding protein